MIHPYTIKQGVYTEQLWYAILVLEINWSYSHSNNCHLHYGEVQILVSLPFFILLLSIVQTFSSNLFIFYAESSFEAIVSKVQVSCCYVKRPSVLDKCQQSPRQFNWSPRQSPIQRNPVLFLQNLSPLNSTLGVFPLDVMPNITLVLRPIPSILFPYLIQIKLSHYQHPCNNLLTDVLLWAHYHSAENGIALPVSGYVIIS